MTLVILAAGMGSRYGGMKQIDPIGPHGEFIIDYSCYDAIRAGFDRIVFVIKKENLELFRESVGCRVEPYAKVEYAFQDINDLPDGFSVPEDRKKPWGTAHALLSTRGIVDDNFATINADDFYGYEAFAEMASRLREADSTAIPMPICFAAYRLANTLTDNGTVSRGICELGENGELISITERTKIRPLGDDAEYEEDGAWTHLSGDAAASMNFFGFTPAFFPVAADGFKRFLSEMKNPEKDEFYLPLAVTWAQNASLATVTACPTKAKWYGVTYAADKEYVKESIRALIDRGVYAEDLWSGLRK